LLMAYAGNPIEKTSSYRAWIEHWQAQRPRLAEQQRAFWTGQLASEEGAWPCDNPRGSHRALHQATVSRTLPSEGLQRRTASVNELLLTALAGALCEWTGRDSVAVELETHGRVNDDSAPDVSRTLGWFTSQFPLRLSGTLQAVQHALQTLPDNGVGYGLLRHELGNGATPEVSFSYLGQANASFGEASAGFAAASEPVGDEHSPHAPLAHELEVVAQISDGQLHLRCNYSNRRYRAQPIERLMDACVAHLNHLLQTEA